MLSLSKLELDKVCKDKKDKLVPKGFGLRLHPRPVESPPGPTAPFSCGGLRSSPRGRPKVEDFQLCASRRAGTCGR